MNNTMPVSVPAGAVPVQWVARIRSIRRVMDELCRVPDTALIILPSTRSALLLARQICTRRSSCVMAGTVASDARWQLESVLRSPSDLAREFAGEPSLPRTVISFPDQFLGIGPSFAWIPFLGMRYSFSVIEALLALRHRPRVFGLRTCSRAGDFALAEVPYLDLLDSAKRLAPLQPLMRRLLAPLEQELEKPPADWLGAGWFALKSEAHWRYSLREELKDMECLLRLHLLSPICDHPLARAALASVVAQRRNIMGTPAQQE